MNVNEIISYIRKGITENIKGKYKAIAVILIVTNCMLGCMLGESINNCTDWLDSTGSKINAHQGGLSRFGNMFYWYGNDFTGNPTGRYGTDGNHLDNGFHLYTSRDLVNWKHYGAVFTQPETGWGSEGTSHSPFVIYNETNQQYVMWFFHYATSYPDVMATVAVADNPFGPFVILGKRETGVTGGYAQDLNVFKDNDGQGYMVYDDGSRNIRVDRLTADYLSSTKQTVIAIPYTSRLTEAPAMCRIGDHYIVAGSGVAGWGNSDTHYAVADAPMGPYTAKGRMGISTPSWAAHQIRSFFYIEESSTTVLWGDQWWIPDSGDINESRYIWLPVSFDPIAETAEIVYQQSWNF